MPISLKAQLGGGGTDPVNSMKLFVSNKRLLEIGPQKWLRSGFIETDVGSYPSAETKSQFDKIATVEPVAPRFTGTFNTTSPLSSPVRFNSVDRTIWAETCTSTLGAGSTYIRYSNDGGTTFQAGLLSSNTTYTWKQVAASGTDAVVIGRHNSGSNPVFTRTSSSFSPVNTEVATTFSGASEVYVTWNGSRYVFVQGVGQTCANMPSGGTSITYSGTSGMICGGLYSHHAGVVLAVGTNTAGTSPLVRRSTDNGVTWSTVFTSGAGRIFKHPTVDRLIMISASDTSVSNIYYSNDAGITWVAGSFSGEYMGYQGLDITANLNGYGELVFETHGIYLPMSFPSGTGGSLMGAWKSTDGGVTWNFIHPTTPITTSGSNASAGAISSVQLNASVSLLNYSCIISNNTLPTSNEYPSGTSKIWKFPDSYNFVGSNILYTEGEYSDIQAYYVRIF